MSTRIFVGTATVALLAQLAGATSLVCPQTSTPTTWSGTTLATTTMSGVTYNSGGANLELVKSGATFRSTSLATPGSIMYAASADFNQDGWADFVGTPEGSSNDYLTIFRNYTWQNENCTTAACTTYSGAQPDWADSTVVVTPKFTSNKQQMAARQNPLASQPNFAFVKVIGRRRSGGA